jgi:hypothetical protein
VDAAAVILNLPQARYVFGPAYKLQTFARKGGPKSSQLADETAQFDLAK